MASMLFAAGFWGWMIRDAYRRGARNAKEEEERAARYAKEAEEREAEHARWLAELEARSHK